jgi:hypothetical protein
MSGHEVQQRVEFLSSVQGHGAHLIPGNLQSGCSSLQGGYSGPKMQVLGREILEQPAADAIEQGITVGQNGDVFSLSLARSDIGQNILQRNFYLDLSGRIVSTGIQHSLSPNQQGAGTQKFPDRSRLVLVVDSESNDVYGHKMSR